MGDRWSKFAGWVGNGLSDNFTKDNINKINAAFATLLVNVLASVGLLIIAFAMQLVNPLLTVVVVSIWASVEGFSSVAIIALLGSKSAQQEDGELLKKFKETVKNPTEENLIDLKDSIISKVEETFIPEEELEPEPEPVSEPEPDDEPVVVE